MVVFQVVKCNSAFWHLETEQWEKCWRDYCLNNIHTHKFPDCSASITLQRAPNELLNKHKQVQKHTRPFCLVKWNKSQFPQIRMYQRVSLHRSSSVLHLFSLFWSWFLHLSTSCSLNSKTFYRFKVHIFPRAGWKTTLSRKVEFNDDLSTQYVRTSLLLSPMFRCSRSLALHLSSQHTNKPWYVV